MCLVRYIYRNVIPYTNVYRMSFPCLRELHFHMFQHAYSLHPCLTHLSKKTVHESCWFLREVCLDLDLRSLSGPCDPIMPIWLCHIVPHTYIHHCMYVCMYPISNLACYFNCLCVNNAKLKVIILN